jgi:hypothetical protein
MKTDSVSTVELHKEGGPVVRPMVGEEWRGVEVARVVVAAVAMGEAVVVVAVVVGSGVAVGVVKQ